MSRSPTPSIPTRRAFRLISGLINWLIDAVAGHWRHEKGSFVPSYLLSPVRADTFARSL